MRKEREKGVSAQIMGVKTPVAEHHSQPYGGQSFRAAEGLQEHPGSSLNRVSQYNPKGLKCGKEGERVFVFFFIGVS